MFPTPQRRFEHLLEYLKIKYLSCHFKQTFWISWIMWCTVVITAALPVQPPRCSRTTPARSHGPRACDVGAASTTWRPPHRDWGRAAIVKPGFLKRGYQFENSILLIYIMVLCITITYCINFMIIHHNLPRFWVQPPKNMYLKFFQDPSTVSFPHVLLGKSSRSRRVGKHVCLYTKIPV